MSNPWVLASVRVPSRDVENVVQIRRLEDEDSLYISRTPVANFYIHTKRDVKFL